jgi:hypothetical protein
MSAPASAPPDSPPGPSRPPRPGAARAAGAGLLAIAVVAGGILLVNRLNAPAKPSPAAAGLSSRTAAASVPAAAPTGAPAVTQSAAPLASTAPPPSAATAAAPGHPTGPTAPVVILNDSKVDQLAAQARSAVEAAGFPVVRIGPWGGGIGSNLNLARTTVFYDGAGLAPAAQALANAVQGVDEVRQIKPGELSRPPGEDGDLLLVVTKYFPSPSPRP